MHPLSHYYLIYEQDLPHLLLVRNCPHPDIIREVCKSLRHFDPVRQSILQAIEKYDLVAIPVIDSIGRLVGQITVDDVMDEVREQSERDYQLASGLSQDVETDDNVLRQTTARLPWLLIGMIGGIGNSMILGNFDSTFAAHPEMALYIPLIGGTGGNVGTQSSAIVVQGLANSSLDAKNTFKQVTKEAVVALINATIISLLVYTYNFIRFIWQRKMPDYGKAE